LFIGIIIQLTPTSSAIVRARERALNIYIWTSNTSAFAIDPLASSSPSSPSLSWRILVKIEGTRATGGWTGRKPCPALDAPFLAG